jgi:hypothetical protein
MKKLHDKPVNCDHTTHSELACPMQRGPHECSGPLPFSHPAKPSRSRNTVAMKYGKESGGYAGTSDGHSYLRGTSVGLARGSCRFPAPLTRVISDRQPCSSSALVRSHPAPVQPRHEHVTFMKATVDGNRVLRTGFVALACLGVGLMITGPTSLAASGADVGVISPTTPVSQTYGHTYGEWSAAWWQYVLSLPAASNPLFDQTGARCAVAQTGPVFFLVGVINVSGTAVRDQCSVPAGKPLFFPILNNECSSVESAPFFGTNRQELAACNHFFMDNAKGLAAEIDGTAVHNLEQFNVCPKADVLCSGVPIISVSLSAKNVLGVPASSGISLGSGYYLLLAPLAPGSHTVHVHGSVPNANFTLDITYNPLVVK